MRLNMVEGVSKRKERASLFKNSSTFTLMKYIRVYHVREIACQCPRNQIAYAPVAQAVAEQVLVEMLLCKHVCRLKRHIGQTYKAYSTQNTSPYPFRNLRGVLFLPSSSRNSCRYAFQPFLSQDLHSMHKDLSA